MELKYRGVSYQASTVGHDAEQTEQIGIYRSVPYLTKSFKASLRGPGKSLVYRGVRYTQ